MNASGLVFRVAAPLTFICALGLSGCGGGGDTARPKTATVSGKVTYKGAAVEGAVVTFSVVGAPRVATGETNASGEFRLTTFDTNDGAIIGDHSVTISKNKAGAGGTEEMTAESYAEMMAKAKDAQRGIPGVDPEQKGELPVRFANAGESGLTRTVVAGEANVFNFDLED